MTKKILIVDDEKKFAELLVEGLASIGYSAKAVYNGADALKIASEEKFNLILLDTMMEGMDGHEVCYLLKKNKKTQNIPVIMLTALDGIKHVENAFEMGADDYLVKPVKLERLDKKLKTFLDG